MEKNFEKPNNTYIDFLKELRNWLCYRENDKDHLRHIIKKYKINENTVIHRAIFYLYKTPRLLWYFNEYMNNLYAGYDIVDTMYNIAQLMKYYQIDKSNNLTYIKSSDYKDTNRTSIIKQITDMNVPSGEFDFFYSLLYKPLTNDTSEEVNTDQEAIIEHIDYMRRRVLPDDIVEFCNGIKANIQQRELCQSCKLFGRKSVVLDTNIDTPGPVDIAFVALNPGTDEPIFDKPLVGLSGTMFRENMYRMPIGTTWVITNIMLCSTSGQSDIGKTVKEVLSVAEHCKEHLQQILTAFPAKIYVPIGGPVMEVFGISGSITNNSGEVFESQGIKVLPIVHPSGARRGGNFKIAYDMGWKTIHNELKKIKEQSDKPKQQSKKKERKTKTTIKNTTSEEEVCSDTMSLLNIETIGNNKILMVLIDTKDGSKHYVVKNIEVPIYVKEESWRECQMLDEPKTIINLNEYERRKLLNTLNDSMNFSKKKLENVVIHQ
jgi:uracil-DNA glycosylase family 4